MHHNQLPQPALHTCCFANNAVFVLLRASSR
jgi:hypothetical protein